MVVGVGKRVKRNYLVLKSVETHDRLVLQIESEFVASCGVLPLYFGYVA